MTKTISQKRLDRPRRILEAAARLTLRYGYAKTTMDDLAREAGVSKGALYLVWPGKEELFDALFEHEMKKLLLDLRSMIENEAGEFTISRLYGFTLLAMQRSPLIAALYTRDGKILGDFVNRQDPERYTRRLVLGVESVAAMQKAGLLRQDLSAGVIAHVFSLMALGMLSISAVIPAQEAPPIDQTVEAVAVMVDGGLALPGGDTSMLKHSMLQMLDLMTQQYSEKENE